MHRGGSDGEATGARNRKKVQGKAGIEHGIFRTAGSKLGWKGDVGEMAIRSCGGDQELVGAWDLGVVRWRVAYLLVALFAHARSSNPGTTGATGGGSD